MNTQDTQQQRFPQATKKEFAYSVQQVDAFLERARAAYDDPDAATDVTSALIRNTAFKVVRKGYAARFVDAAMDRLEEVFFERELRQREKELSVAAWQQQMRELAREVCARGLRPPKKKFRRRSVLAVGYKRSQVDAFVLHALTGLAGRGQLTVSQVREALFHTEVGGYDEAQVDAFMDAITELLLAQR